MPLCDPIMEDKVSCHKNSAAIKSSRDTIKLLQVIKQLMYLKGIEEIHTIHNQVMAKINLLRMRQERGQSPQNFWEQFNAMRQVRNQLGLCIRQSDQGAQAILKRKESQAQLLSNWKKQQRGHAILFLYLAIRQQYGKILEDM